MRAEVVHVAHPFPPAGASVRIARRPHSLARLAPRTRAPVIAVLNGVPVLRAHRGWHRRRLRDGDHLQFVILPLDGGGGRGGSDPMQAILSIALFAVAGPLAGLLVPGGAAAAAGSWAAIGYNAARAGIVLAGASLINAIVPAPRSPRERSPSPAWSITAQGNAARIGQPIPVRYGRMRIWPDFAAMPHAEFAGAEQYLYQLFCLGCGEYEVEEIRIEDTPISAFPEIDYEIVPPGGEVTLFPTAVTTSVEVSGQEIVGMKTGTWTRSGAAITITKSNHGIAAGQAVAVEFTSGSGPDGVWPVTSVPGSGSFVITATATGTSGNCEWRPVLGGLDGFVSAAAGTVTRHLGIDLVLPNGLYDRNAETGKLNGNQVKYILQARKVDDQGAPAGDWITLTENYDDETEAVVPAETIRAKAAKPLRYSRRWAVAAGRYRVRAWRVNADESDDNSAELLLLGGLRAYLRAAQDWGPVTLIAMRMRATNSLSAQASRRISVIATRKLPVWTGSAWTAPQPTRSIAWAIADVARNADYGPGLPDRLLDLAGLLALDALWTSRGDNFSDEFVQGETWWEAMQVIAAAGRARVVPFGSAFRVVRDGPQSVPVAMFSMRNIAPGSFKLNWLLPEAGTARAVEVTYLDGTTWQPQKVTARIQAGPGKPAKLRLRGPDNRAQALREGLYHAATNRYRRRLVSFETEMEGFIPAFGELIAVQHDTPAWGAHAEAVSWDAASRTLTLTEPPPAVAGLVIGLRRPDGSIAGPLAATAAGDRRVVLAGDPDFTPLTGPDRERSHVAMGGLTSWAAQARVVAVRPAALNRVRIEAVIEDPSVHTAEEGVTAPPIRPSLLPRRVVAPVVDDIFARRIPGEASRVVLGWRPAAGAETYHVEMAEGDDPAEPEAIWTRVADIAAPELVASLMFALRTMIRVRGEGLTAGPWIATTIGSLIPAFWSNDLDPFWTSDGDPFWSNA